MAREDGPFEYFDERTNSAGVTATSIRANLTDPEKNNAVILALAEELDDDGDAAVKNIDGDIDTAVKNLPAGAKATATNLGKNGAYALGLMREFAGNVETFDKATSHCNWKYNTQLADAMRWAGKAAAATKDDKEDDKKVDEAHLGPSIESYIRTNDYTPAWNTLDEQMDGLVTDFNTGPTDEKVRDLIKNGLLPLEVASMFGLTLTDAEKKSYYEHVLGNLSPEEQKQWIKDHIKNLDPAVASVVDPEVQKYFADEVAKDIKDPKNIDEDTVALMNMFKGEDAFTKQLFENVSPQEFSDAIVYLNEQLKAPGDTGMGIEYSDKDPESLLKIYDGFMNAGGVGLATYSNADGVNPTALADEWLGAITDDRHPANAAALTLLMREGGEQKDGDFNATFIDHVASGALDWEKQRQEEYPGQAVWGPRAGGLHIMDPDKIDILNNYGSGDNWNFGIIGTESHDGMANLLGAMGHSPEGAQRFFMTSDGEVDKDKLDYLMLHRTFSSSVGSDEGDGLGEALQAATIMGTEGKNGDYTSEEADKLTSGVFKLISENSSLEDKDDLGKNPYGGKLDGGTGDGWHIWQDMSDSLGAIAANYSDDIYSEVGPGTGSESRLDGISDRDILRVVAEIGGTKDQSGLTTLLAAVANSGVNHEVGNNLDTFVDKQHANGEPVNMTTLAKSGITLDTRVIGETLGKLINASDDVFSDKAMSESHRRELAAKAFDIGTSFLPGAGKIVGEGGSELLKTALDTGKGEAISQMQDAIKGNGPNPAPNHSRNLEDSIRYAISNQYLQHGLLNEQPDPNNHQTGHYDGVYKTNPPITTTNEAGQPVFDPDLFYDTEKAPDHHAGWDAYQDTAMENKIRKETGDMTDGMGAALNTNFNSDKPTID